MKRLVLCLLLSTPAISGEVPNPGAVDQGETGKAVETTGSKETLCKQDTRVRRVTLSTSNEEGLACKVSYLKESELPGQAKVLWSAKEKPGYCQEQATAFVQKLQSWGWTCQ